MTYPTASLETPDYLPELKGLLKTESRTTIEIPFDCPNCKKTFYITYRYSHHN
jgi:hypothetical protein